ncbi:class III extradiol ring-cleavage dioxygenase [Janthinobacterium sp.]|uniref:DODA-type extradiol aromatic ring-opening family dioxygenase n=1 Tax=Janthinobacterium sp. TaxID=1871054 RepID=UPI00293D50C4|nr:class III extradiol ring-cleavage dioxygenase [Janthinobacterium sp.]
MSDFQFPTYFLSHGGGPWPFMMDQYGGRYDQLLASLQDIPRQIGRAPKALLVVTAHWEGPDFLISSGERPGMIYDYSGFPAHTYELQYPAPGSPPLAARVKALLEGAGLPASLDARRGFDHGTFSVLYPIYPAAEVPVVQLSLKHGYDALTHVRAGRALAGLRREGVLIIGSGLSYHNLRQFGAGGGHASQQFDTWLRAAMALPPAERLTQLLAWDQAPAARQAHPYEDHLLPLMVALGAAEQEAAATVYHEDEFFGALAVSSFRFGAPAAQ